MNDRDNYLKTAELSTEQNTNMIDGIMNNATMAPPVPVPAPEVKPLDKVKPPTRRSRTWERER